MYRVEGFIDPTFDNKVMVKKWEFVAKSQVSENDPTNHVYFYDNSQLPEGCVKSSLGFYIEDGKLKKLGQ